MSLQSRYFGNTIAVAFWGTRSFASAFWETQFSEIAFPGNEFPQSRFENAFCHCVFENAFPQSRFCKRIPAIQILKTRSGNRVSENASFLLQSRFWERVVYPRFSQRVSAHFGNGFPRSCSWKRVCTLALRTTRSAIAFLETRCRIPVYGNALRNRVCGNMFPLSAIALLETRSCNRVSGNAFVQSRS